MTDPLARALTAAFALAASAPALAVATEPSAPEMHGAVTVYAPDWFVAFNALTAFDMVARVPGFTLETVDSHEVSRGFGGVGGNVLIDGRRPSTKEGLDAVLRRIPASAVERVELIRGPVAGVDMRGRTEMVNVVRRSGAALSGAATLEGRVRESAPATWGAELSAAGALGAWSWSADVQRDSAGRSREDGVERELGADGALRLERAEITRETYEETGAGLQAGRDLGRARLNVNAQAGYWTFDEYARARGVDAGGAVAELRDGTVVVDNRTVSAGGDISAPLGERMTLKLIGLASAERETGDEVFREDRPGAGGDSLRLGWRDEMSERIARLLLTVEPGGAHTFETGVEGAVNVLDTDFTLEEETGAGFVPVEVPGADTRIEEVRGEAFGSWVWRAGPRLTLESGLVLEASRISQSGDAENERSFFYPKPRLSASFARTPAEQLTVRLEREVSQLDFGDFASFTELEDDQTNLGNPELEPYKTWLIEADWERRVWSDGLVSLTLRHELRQDVLDFLPLTAPSGARFDALGNIGDGRVLQLTAAWDLPLDRFGLTGARISGNANWADTQVTDPATGVDRRLSDYNGWWGRVDFRHDLPGQPWSWGFDYAQSGDSLDFRLAELRERREGPGDLDLFVETTALPQVTLRLDLENLGDVETTRDRIFYRPDRAAGAVSGRQIETSREGRVLRISASATF